MVWGCAAGRRRKNNNTHIDTINICVFPLPVTSAFLDQCEHTFLMNWNMNLFSKFDTKNTHTKKHGSLKSKTFIDLIWIMSTCWIKKCKKADFLWAKRARNCKGTCVGFATCAGDYSTRECLYIYIYIYIDLPKFNRNPLWTPSNLTS